MAARFYLGAYWRPRGDDTANSAERAAEFLAELSSVNASLLSTWFETGNTAVPDPDLAVPADAAALEKLLAGGQGDQPQSQGAGTSVSLWNGGTPQVGLSMNTSVSATFAGQIDNAVVLTLPSADDAPDLYTPNVALALIRAAVDAWDPDWATVTSHKLRRGQGVQAGDLTAGWATYIRNSAPPTAAPDAVDVYETGTGTLAVVRGPVEETEAAQASVVREWLAAGARLA